MRIILQLLYILPVLGFDFLSGKYKVLYPNKKIVKFTEKNNVIIEKSLLQLKLHPENRMYFYMKYINNNTLSLENIKNSSDLMILQIK